ncbi:amidase signature domain-containing protein [Bombardia bombarda]|uniref:Amidase signature domain-containing protein n=1 Tax=Bombardia bombarda TaxID=252184 RepID=A0AA39T153_9PEZI|nr:amidase signature domain-containing protein [Bombardia bombarda]
MSTTSGLPSAEKVSATLERFLHEDDVWCSAFQSTLVIQTRQGPEVTADASTCPTIRVGDSHLKVIQLPVNATAPIPDGPYFLVNHHLHEAWRLFPDTADAFFAPLQPDSEKTDAYTWLGVSGIFGPTLAVAVPSRLYFPPDPRKPLNGLRIAVKDNYDIKGVHTVASNKSFLKLREPAAKTAPAIQDLINKGAVIVGKTKMTSFADREYPPSDWIDYHCPFNPRGDGYLVPQGSSTGSAAAVAAYEWLDAGFGTDTSASVRMPASGQGIFGLRSSWGTISLEGVIPLVKRFDVVGFLARDIKMMQLLGREMNPAPKTTKTTAFPKQILYNPDWLKGSKLAEARSMLDDFVEKLEEFLGVKKTVVDVESAWTEEDPMGTGKPFREQFLNTYERIHGPATLEYQSAWAKEYANKFGKAPYLPPSIKNRWPYVKTITSEQVAEAYKEADAYKDWFQKRYLFADNETSSTAIMVGRWTWRLEHRDVLRENPNTGKDYGFSVEFGPSYAGLPELVFCIGQLEYESPISQTREYYPVSMSIIGAKGSDQMLLKLAEEFLAFAGVPSKVLTGRTAFPAPEHHLPSDWHL